MLEAGDASAAQRGEVLRTGGEDRDRPGAANAVAVWRAISLEVVALDLASSARGHVAGSCGEISNAGRSGALRMLRRASRAARSARNARNAH